MILPTLADRAWFAYHCLPRDRRGKLPFLKELELEHGLSGGTLSHMMSGRRSQFRFETMPKISEALRVSEPWLRGDEDARGPTLTGPLPPRPGTKWIRHGEVPGWRGSVELARLEPRQIVPPGGFLLGAEMVVYRPIDRITPGQAIAAALYAYEFSTPDEQAKYSTLEAREANHGHNSGKMRAAALKRPAAK